MVAEALVDRALDAIRDKQALGVLCTLGEEAKRALWGERERGGERERERERENTVLRLMLPPPKMEL